MDTTTTTHAAPDDTTQSSGKVRVLVVDDSSMTRWLMREMLQANKDLVVVGTASDALDARKKIKQLTPDVITLDIEMPGMNGLDFLKNLMRLHPLPVVMVSSHTEHGADVTLDALSIGAVDYICKPRLALSPPDLAAYASELAAKVKTASAARISALRNTGSAPYYDPVSSNTWPTNAAIGTPSKQIIAIGASTGGTEAISAVLGGLPNDGPGVVLVQHISDSFNAHFVRRLDSQVGMQVRQARSGDIVRKGSAYIAPSGFHLMMRHKLGTWRCELSQEEPVNFHKPSVDVLFNSIATEAGEDAIGIILTGMGSDGAKGLAAMRRSGAVTIAQDEQSSVVWGMPGASVKLDAVEKIAPLSEIPALIKAYCKRLS